ncbi:hypothetical protein LJC22_07455 [Desulfosarcina sp. OttesenSCG-928-G10]|nr:hypothetical protein [Desulfosarcina sp. OttesenSCG-928-G10]
MKLPHLNYFFTAYGIYVGLIGLIYAIDYLPKDIALFILAILVVPIGFIVCLCFKISINDKAIKILKKAYEKEKTEKNELATNREKTLKDLDHIKRENLCFKQLVSSLQLVKVFNNQEEANIELISSFKKSTALTIHGVGGNMLLGEGSPIRTMLDDSPGKLKEIKVALLDEDTPFFKIYAEKTNRKVDNYKKHCAKSREGIKKFAQQSNLNIKGVYYRYPPLWRFYLTDDYLFLSFYPDLFSKNKDHQAKLGYQLTMYQFQATTEGTGIFNSFSSLIFFYLFPLQGENSTNNYWLDWERPTIVTKI